jgi:hypothetical protein
MRQGCFLSKEKVEKFSHPAKYFFHRRERRERREKILPSPRALR